MIDSRPAQLNQTNITDEKREITLSNLTLQNTLSFMQKRININKFIRKPSGENHLNKILK